MKKNTTEKEVIKVLEPEITEPFTHYELVALDEKGKEKGLPFSISKKGFAQTYINRTAKPDGNAAKSPKFKVKKKY